MHLTAALPALVAGLAASAAAVPVVIIRDMLVDPLETSKSNVDRRDEDASYGSYPTYTTYTPGYSPYTTYSPYSAAVEKAAVATTKRDMTTDRMDDMTMDDEELMQKRDNDQTTSSAYGSYAPYKSYGTYTSGYRATEAEAAKGAARRDMMIMDSKTVDKTVDAEMAEGMQKRDMDMERDKSLPYNWYGTYSPYTNYDTYPAASRADKMIDNIGMNA